MKTMFKRLNLIGQKFSRLEVIADAGNNKWSESLWKCKCDCGNEVIVVGDGLRSGHTKSCGCLQREITSKLNKNRKWSMESKKKISEANKGRIVSKETRQKISKLLIGNNYGYKHGLSYDKEHLKEYHKQWYEDNKEYWKKHIKEYRQNNRGKVNARNAKRKAIKLNQTPTNANIGKIQEIYSICSLMNEISIGIKWHVDHIIPLSKGGLHHQDNLQILEAGTNLRKSNKLIKENF
jgi:5-methylcytosine-specific restriction endonuclease McrA